MSASPRACTRLGDRVRDSRRNARPSPSGRRSTWVWLGRRSTSLASSVRPRRIATNASCSSARSRAVRVDVTRRDVRTPSRRGEALRARGCAACRRGVGTLQLDPQALAAECIEELARGRLVIDAVLGAAGQADQALGVLEHALERNGRLAGMAIGRAHACCAWASVSSRQRLRQPRRVSHQQRDVPVASPAGRRQLDATSAPKIARTGESRAAIASSIAPASESWSVSASALWPSSAARSISSPGQRGAVQERVGGMAVQLDIRWRPGMLYRFTRLA